MNKFAALKLKRAAWQAAELFSSKERDYNYSKEQFTVTEIIPLSDDLAWVVFSKTGGKKSGAVFYHLSMDDGTWRFFFPTDSHLLGMVELQRRGLKQQLEEFNLPLNEEGEVVV